MDFQSWRDFDWRRGVTGALGLFQAFRRETNLLIAGLTGISGVATGGCPESGFVSDARSTHGTSASLSFLTIAGPLSFLFGLWSRRGSTAVLIHLPSKHVVNSASFAVPCGEV